MFKVDWKSLINIGTVVAQGVQAVQAARKGKSAGHEKHEIVRDAAVQALPVIEGLTGVELNDPLIIEAIDSLIVAEKAVLKAREKVAAVIADVKAKRSSE